MNKRLIATAYHEAGHVAARLLTNRRFKKVTIIPSKGKVDNQIESFGHVDSVGIGIDWDGLSFVRPLEFRKFFISDFISVSGVVAEKIHTGRFNYGGANSDFRHWEDTTLLNLSEELGRKYQKFLFKYTEEVFSMDENWRNITAIAESLLEKKTLKYNEVLDVVKQSNIIFYQSVERKKIEIEQTKTMLTHPEK